MMLQMTKREQIGAVVLAGLLITGLALRVALAPKPAEIVIDPPPQTEQSEKVKQAEIMVHVAGAVQNPGVYRLPEGARVVDALQAAGGALPEADPHALNLAEPLYDGRRVYVSAANGEGGEGEGKSGKMNINTADAGELEKLPGIGPAKAAAIVSYREQNGPFRSPEELANVSGIGQKTMEQLKEYITIY